jgi:hypothetical protein
MGPHRAARERRWAERGAIVRQPRDVSRLDRGRATQALTLRANRRAGDCSVEIVREAMAKMFH